MENGDSSGNYENEKVFDFMNLAMDKFLVERLKAVGIRKQCVN